MAYVTSADMQLLYEPDLLVRVTNYTDPQATTINTDVLDGACESGSALVDSYLLRVKVSPSKYSDRFKNILKIHSARLAIDCFVGVTDRIHEQAKESIEWLKGLAEMTQADLQMVIAGDNTVVNPTIARVARFNAGRSWGVTFERATATSGVSAKECGTAGSGETIVLPELPPGYYYLVGFDGAFLVGNQP